MSVRFGMPAGRQRKAVHVSCFEGVNFTDSPAGVDERKSPDAPNMIRDVPGKVRKCMGYYRVAEYRDEQGRPLAINGWHRRSNDETGLIHAGERIYRGEELLYSAAADSRSRSWQLSRNDGEKTAQCLYIQDGKDLLVYDGEQVRPAAECAYVPTLTIAKQPSGGGTEYEPLNLIGAAFRELFSGTQTAVNYQLTFGELDETPVKAWVLNSRGEWTEKRENIDFSVNRQTGVVTFISAPGSSPVTGEDNVKIEASRTVEGYRERIGHCTCGILFGVGGNADRLFVGGSTDPEYRNYDWYSGQYDATYWPDTAYATVGSAAAGVVGYTIVDNYLAAVKGEGESDRSVVIREGNLINSEPAFPVINTLQGPGAVAPWSFVQLASEPLFLTRLGVYALTISDVSGNRYSQRRSYYLDGKLLREENLREAYGYTHNDLYWLCINGTAYILDSLQPLTAERSAPYSTRQYAGFYRTHLPARVMWEENGKLCFGSEKGVVYRFYEDPNNPLSYNDDGEPIDAYWTTGYQYGGAYERDKAFRKLSVLVDSAPVTGVDLLALRDGRWEKMRVNSAVSRYLAWQYICWERWNWSTDDTPRTLVTRPRTAKADKTQYRFRNKELNQPFGLLQYACEYSVGGYFGR